MPIRWRGHWDDWYEVSTAPRTSSCTSSWGPGPAISREGTVRRPGRQYGGGWGREALRPLRGSAWSSDDKNPGGNCASAIHLRGQHVSPNTPRRTAKATIKAGVRPLRWARGQQRHMRALPSLWHVPSPAYGRTAHCSTADLDMVRV